MLDNCPRCDLRFERMEGHSLGAVAVNTVVSAAVVLMAVVFALLVFGIDYSNQIPSFVSGSSGAFVPNRVRSNLKNALERHGIINAST